MHITYTSDFSHKTGVMANASVLLNFTSIEQPPNVKKYMRKCAYKLVSIKEEILHTVLGWVKKSFFFWTLLI